MKMQGVHTKAQISYVKEKIISDDPSYKKAYEQLLIRANDALNRKPHAVENYFVPWYYVTPDVHIENSKLLTGDAYAAYACALTYRLTDQTKYAEKARELINQWAGTNTTLRQTEDTALVAANGAVGLVIAAELLEEYPDWKQDEQEAFQAWVLNKYQPAIDSIKTHTNNWGCWGTMAAMITYCYQNNQEGVIGEIERLKTLIESQIAPEGVMPEEAKRGNNSMWYHYFALAPLTAAAQVAKNATGTDIFEYVSPNGKSIKTALDYFFYYVKNPNEWPHHDPKTLSKPHLGDGITDGNFSNWPTSLYTAISYIYPQAEYAELVNSYAPVLGGWNTERGAHHIAWCFPSLMRP